MLSPPELALRLLSLISAASRLNSPFQQTWGDYLFKAGLDIVEHGQVSVQLESNEFDLALELFCNIGQILPRERLMKCMHGTELNIQHRSLDVALGC